MPGEQRRLKVECIHSFVVLEKVIVRNGAHLESTGDADDRVELVLVGLRNQVCGLLSDRLSGVNNNIGVAVLALVNVHRDDLPAGLLENSRNRAP